MVKHDTFLDRSPVFTGAELAAYLEDCGHVGARTKERFLAHHRAKGRVIRLRRGLYAVVPRNADPDSMWVHPYLVAPKLTPDAVLSHHSALDFHGEAHSVWSHVIYSASRPLPPLELGGNLYRGARFPKALTATGDEHSGVKVESFVAATVRVASLERTLVDVLAVPDLAGGWEEIWRSFYWVESLNIGRVVDYTLLLDNATTCAKVGFFLEQHRDLWAVTDHHLERLRDRAPRQPHYLERRKRQPGIVAKGWNLVVPPDVLNQSWANVL